MGAAEKRGAALCDTLLALHEEHLPPELHQRARMLLNDVVALGSDAALAELARLYRALVGRLPGDVAQIREAFEATAFEEDRNDASDWQFFESMAAMGQH